MDDDILLMDNHNIISIFDTADGSLWIVTDKGINVFDGTNWKKIDNKNKLMKKAVGAALLDSKDRVWIGTGTPEYFFDMLGTENLYGGGLLVYDGTDWKPILTKDIGFKAPIVSRIFEHSSGDIWVGVQSVRPGAEGSNITAKGAILRYTNDEWIVYRYKDIPCLSCDFVKGFAEDSDGKLWIWGTEGLAYFEDEKFHSMRKKNGYLKSGQRITATYIDSDDRFWVAGPGKAARWNGDSWTTYTRKNGLATIDWGAHGFVETSDNKIALSVANGVYRFDGAESWERDKKEVLSSRAYIDKQDRTWAPTFKGLEIRDGTKAILDKDLKAVWGIIPDNNGGVWAFSPKDGAKRFKDGQWTHYREDNQLPSSKIQLGHVTESGVIWVGTKKGICKCEYE